MNDGATGLPLDSIELSSNKRIEWEHVDVALRTIAKRRGALDALEAKWLREAIRVKIWREVGCVSLVDYLERRLGYAPRTAHDRVRVATALAELPAIETALAAGLPHSAVRELTRVATPETEQKWLDACRGKSVHEIEREVAGRARGALPGDPLHADLVGRTVPFEGIRPVTLALIRDARRRLQQERGSGGALSDDDLLSSLARAVLEGSGAEATRAPYQIAVTLCEQCGAGWQESGGRKYALSRADLERACCDAQRIGSLDSDDPARAAQDVPPRVRRFVIRRDGGKCRVPGCRSTRCLELHHIVARILGGSHDAENLILLCDGCHAAHHRGLIAISGTASNLIVERLRAVTYDMEVAESVDLMIVDEVSETDSSMGLEPCAHVGTNARQRVIDVSEPAVSEPDRRVEGPTANLEQATTTPAPLELERLRADARSALVSLGFRRAEAGKAVDNALTRVGSSLSLEILIREALRSGIRV